MKTASQVSQKWSERAANASGDYVEGARTTTKDQSTAAIAAAAIWKQAIDAAATRGAFAKGLQKSGKAGWLKGVTQVGGNRFAEGVGQGAPKYAQNSAPFDTARAAAASMPRGLKGSPQNLSRVAAVVAAQIKQKNG